MGKMGLRPKARRERPDEFGSSGLGKVAVYQGTRPAEAEIDVTAPPKPKSVAKLKRSGLTHKEALFLHAMVGSNTYIEAYEKAFPLAKLKYATRRSMASRLHTSILGKLGEEGVYEAMGIGRHRVMEKIRQLVEAKSVKEFIVPDTGEIVTSEPRPDNTTQMNATKLLAGIHKMVDDGKGGTIGNLVVNVVNYAPPGAPAWPGGGRG